VLVTVDPARIANAPAPPSAGAAWLLPVADVVNVHTRLLARALPAKSSAPVVTVAVYVVLAASALVGVNVAIPVDVLYVTAPATGVAPGPLTLNVVVVMVEAFIASLHVAVMTATPVAPLTGLVELTVGATVSPPGPLGFLSDELHPAIAIRSATNGKPIKLRVR
jgi:hypothetical protein